MAHDMPSIETYRGVRIHDFQPRKRIEETVKPAIDDVYTMNDAQQLFDYARDNQNPPEARLFAAARCEATWQIAAETRTTRPPIDIALLRAHVAGLNCRRWIDLRHYTTALDPWNFKAPLRETPLREEDLRRDA
jgi:hypothetical protein